MIAYAGVVCPEPGTGVPARRILLIFLRVRRLHSPPEPDRESLVRWRTEVVRMLPQTASLYAAVGLPVNLRGLDFKGVQTTSNQNDGTGILVVEGSIVNSTSRKIDLPRLYFSVRDERGLEIYNWTAPAPKPALGPGEALPFRSRLASPPPETYRVTIRFRNRRDLVGGLN